MISKIIFGMLILNSVYYLSQQNPTPIEKTLSLEKFLNNTYDDCISKKIPICTGMPSGCVSAKNCDVLLTSDPTQTGADFQMFWNYNQTKAERWVGAALSLDKNMGNDSVTECIISTNNTLTVRQGLTYGVGEEGYGVTTVEPVKGITNETGNIEDNVVYCRWSRTTDTVITSAKTGTIDFDISKNDYYVLLAYGPVGKDIKHHTHQWVSDSTFHFGVSESSNGTKQSTQSSVSTTTPVPQILEQIRNKTYDDCIAMKIPICTGMPSGCVQKKNCDVLLTSDPTQTGADFQMFWNLDNSTKDRWVGAALSSDKNMGKDSVTECILWANNTLDVRQGLTYCKDDSCGVTTVEPVKGITNETGSVEDNIVYCRWSRTIDTEISSNKTGRMDFNISETDYYVLLAYGPVDKDIRHHTHQWVSDNTYHFGAVPQTLEQMRNKTYDDCIAMKIPVCTGMPTDCVKTKSCDVLLTSDSTQTGADFQIFWGRDNTTQDRYVGAALSSDRRMGNDSVTECILWKNNTLNVRQGLTYCNDNGCGVTTVEPVKGITNETGSVEENIVYCRWSRTTDTEISSNKTGEIDFNILMNDYYVLLVYGPIGKDIQHHDHQWASKMTFHFGEKAGNSTTKAPQTTTSRVTPKVTTPKPTPNASIINEYSICLIALITIISFLNFN